MESKIFISIASYRDPLLHNTVMSAYNNASRKDRLVFGVVDQSFPGEFFNLRSLPFADQVRYLRIDPEYGRGACWARNLAQSMWNKEKYFLQVDSHTLFEERWDEIFLNYMGEFEKYHEKPLITAYPHGFVAVDNNINNLRKSGYDGLLTLVADQAHSFNNDMYVGIQARVLPSGMPVHGFLISANCLFTHGVICEEVPYDPYLYFSGEEHSLALRLWTSGYNIFHVAKIPLYHHYGREYRTTVWSDDFIEKNRPQKWYLYDRSSKDRLVNIVTGKLGGAYGLGNKRKLDEYIQWCGIDYFNKTLNINAVSGNEIFKLDYKQPPIGGIQYGD
jgi:hypothetical protein